MDSYVKKRQRMPTRDLLPVGTSVLKHSCWPWSTGCFTDATESANARTSRRSSGSNKSDWQNTASVNIMASLKDKREMISGREKMKAEIFLKHEEKGRLLARTSRHSLARSVLASAQRRSNQPQLVTITCDEQGAAAILEVAQQHNDNTSRVIKCQMKRLGLLRSIRQER
jgi:hypothetical protein